MKRADLIKQVEKMGRVPKVRIEIELKDDGRWLTEVKDLPGVMGYGQSCEEAISKVEALALRVIADRLEHGESIPDAEIIPQVQ